jgi:L-fucose isomerase-like protein
MENSGRRLSALKPKVGFFMMVHPYEEGAEKAPELFRRALGNLIKIGAEVVEADEVVEDEKSALRAAKKFKKNGIDLLCLVEATWSSDYLALDILEEIEVPIITWALPGIRTGSLCGTQQLDCVLTELRKTYKFVYGAVEEENVYQKVKKYARAVSLKNHLRTTRLGLIGYRIPGMTEVTFDEYELKSLFGPRIVHLGIDKFKESLSKISHKEVEPTWAKVKARVGKVNTNEEEGLHSVKAYLALKEFVERKGLAGLAVECYPDLMGEVCLAYSLLAEEGIVAACEGDVNSLLAMLMLYLLTGEPIHNTDLLAVHEEDSSAVFSHCGSGGFSLAEHTSDISLEPVRLANKGVCVLFPGRPGEVTLVNLVGRKGTYRMCIVGGEAVKTEMVFPGNPVRVRLPVNTEEFLKIISREGFGHHWMIGYGDLREELVEFCGLTGLRCVSI